MSSIPHSNGGDLDEFIRGFSGLLTAELSELEKLSVIGKQVEQKLTAIYREKFPKTCNTCERVFATREEYLEATNPTEKHGIRWDDFIDKVQEYRNCTCGSTLVIMVPDRRDMSPFGIERRRLFSEFVGKIVQLPGQEQVVVEGQVRVIFRQLAKMAAMQE